MAYHPGCGGRLFGGMKPPHFELVPIYWTIKQVNYFRTQVRIKRNLLGRLISTNSACAVGYNNVVKKRKGTNDCGRNSSYFKNSQQRRSGAGFAHCNRCYTLLSNSDRIFSIAIGRSSAGIRRSNLIKATSPSVSSS